MIWMVLEAFAALLVLLFIVWWTMFAGRRSGERAEHATPANAEPVSEPAPAQKAHKTQQADMAD